MSNAQLTSDPGTMDRLQANPQLHYGLNGSAGRNSGPGEDDAMQYLSRAEQECIQFLEETIDSFEDAVVERPGPMKPPDEEPDRPQTSTPSPDATVPYHMDRPRSPKDQDIIDLVRPEPDLVPSTESMFTPTTPDFQSVFPAPESHFEVKPRRDPSDSLPSEYTPALPGGSYGPTDIHSSYHPPGSIPTPVLIAQKIAENQSSGTSSILPSSLRRRSLDSEKPTYGMDPLVKQGPPTSAKPTRFPSNINVILGSKDHQNQSLANVNIHERRTQMLTNLSGSHPLLQEVTQQAADQKSRNIPKRSISFKDPTPDKSRMEALSKLGLTRNRAMSGGTSLMVSPDSPSPESLPDAKPLEASAAPITEVVTKLPEVNVSTSTGQSQNNGDRKSEILRTDSLKTRGDRDPQPSQVLPAVTQSSYPPPPVESKAPVLPPPEVTSLEFNSYGGKSIVVNPSASFKSEPATSPTAHEPKTLPPALANPSEFNSYGGKTKVMVPVPAAIPRNDLPDILSSHIDKNQSLTPKPEQPPPEFNSYGGRSHSFSPSAGANRPPNNTQTKSFKAPAPTPAPRPPRHSYHGHTTPQKAAHRALSPEHKRRSSMFRPQGITVQFAGRGATDESRREALRKLGLLKD